MRNQAFQRRHRVRLGILSHLRRDRSGMAAVEFALVAAPFFFVVFAIVETALATAAGVMLNNAVNNAARQVLVGAVSKGDMDARGFRQAICADVSGMLSCERLKLDLRTFPAGSPIAGNLRLKEGAVDATGFCFDPGSQDTIVVLRAYYEWPWTAAILSRIAEATNGNAVLSATAAFMNEPFGGALNANSDC